MNCFFFQALKSPVLCNFKTSATVENFTSAPARTWVRLQWGCGGMWWALFLCLVCVLSPHPLHPPRPWVEERKARRVQEGFNLTTVAVRWGHGLLRGWGMMLRSSWAGNLPRKSSPMGLFARTGSRDAPIRSSDWLLQRHSHWLMGNLWTSLLSHQTQEVWTTSILPTPPPSVTWRLICLSSHKRHGTHLQSSKRFPWSSPLT